MATYAIGDVQGCLEPLQRLLDRIGFEPASDRLWFCGDLVNRGPDSLGALRLVRALGGSAVSVIGNHDLHLLARAEGLRPASKRDTMDDVLAAPDREELLSWLAGRPFVHVEELRAVNPARREEGDQALEIRRFLLVHAGLMPEWSVAWAIDLAAEATASLRSDRRAFLEAVYEGPPMLRWSEDPPGPERLRRIVTALVRLRMLDETGAIDDDYTGPPDEAPPGHVCWFDARGEKAPPATTIVFGHWAALGLLVREDVVGLDTGCVWGNSLTAYRLEDGRVFSVPAEP